MLNDGYAEHIVKGKTPAGVMAGIVAGAILIVAGVVAFFIPLLTSSKCIILAEICAIPRTLLKICIVCLIAICICSHNMNCVF